MPLQPGVRLGPYEIHSAIGAGGMGEVWRARDTSLGRDVALKVLPDHLALDPDRLGRFKREAQILASLNHPNIATIHGFQESDGVQALVLELVEGPTLADRIAQGAIPVDEALSIAKQVTEALEAAHEQGIIHRDLKPANIKLRPDGTVKVLDFGLAKALGPEPGQSALSLSSTITSPVVTGPAVLLGTAGYMAPEQATGKIVDKRSDIWAFGVVLYEMLSGRSPFAAETTVEVLGKVLQADPDWTALPPTTPATIRSLLKRCLHRDRARRLRDIADARFQLEEAISEPAAPLATGVAVRSARNRERWFWVAALVAVASVAAGMVGYLRQPPVQLDEVRLEINTPPTTAPTSMAISPDGRTLVFAALAGGTEQLWVRSLDAPSARPLAGTERARYPFWSPDSRSVGFFADAQLKRIDVESAAVQTLAPAGIPLGGAWSGDDTIFFTPGPASPVVRVASTGGQPTPVTRVTAEAANHRFPQVLPDGRHLLYYATGTAPGIYVSRLDGSEPRRLLEADSAVYSAAGHLLFQRQGVLFAQTFDLERLELTGRPFTLAQQVRRPSLAGSGGAVSIGRPHRLSIWSAGGRAAARLGQPVGQGARKSAWLQLGERHHRLVVAGWAHRGVRAAL